MNIRWLLRARLWAARPPSERRIKLVFGVIGLAIAIFLIERYVGWPDALTLDPSRARIKP